MSNINVQGCNSGMGGNSAIGLLLGNCGQGGSAGGIANLFQHLLQGLGSNSQCGAGQASHHQHHHSGSQGGSSTGGCGSSNGSSGSHHSSGSNGSSGSHHSSGSNGCSSGSHHSSSSNGSSGSHHNKGSNGSQNCSSSNNSSNNVSQEINKLIGDIENLLQQVMSCMTPCTPPKGFGDIIHYNAQQSSLGSTSSMLR